MGLLLSFLCLQASLNLMLLNTSAKEEQNNWHFSANICNFFVHFFVLIHSSYLTNWGRFNWCYHILKMFPNAFDDWPTRYFLCSSWQPYNLLFFWNCSGYFERSLDKQLIDLLQCFGGKRGKRAFDGKEDTPKRSVSLRTFQLDISYVPCIHQFFDEQSRRP